MKRAKEVRSLDRWSKKWESKIENEEHVIENEGERTEQR